MWRGCWLVSLSTCGYRGQIPDFMNNGLSLALCLDLEPVVAAEQS